MRSENESARQRKAQKQRQASHRLMPGKRASEKYLRGPCRCRLQPQPYKVDPQIIVNVDFDCGVKGILDVEDICPYRKQS